ncbi:MAG: GIY-YIG nuclease family protein [Rhodothermales bacterium]|nr:GIY-YIG nuclease family protein [Rhodothermales bacterium]
MNRTYSVYILSNRRRTVLYIGVTNDLLRRLAEHAVGIGGAFTSTYRAT